MQFKGLASLLQHHSSKTSILLHSAFFMVQLSYPYMTTGKTIVLTRQTFVGKVVSLLVDVFLEFSCFFYDPMDVGNLISGPSAFINPA